MKYDIRKRPSYAVLDVELEDGEEVQSKPGAMMTRDATVDADANLGGNDGVTGMVKRAVSDERGMVDTTFTARESGASVTLVPPHPGDVSEIDLGETGPIKTQSGALLAWEPTVERTTQLNDFGNLFSSGELTVLGLSGDGLAFVSSYGSMYEETVSADDPLIVDEDHLVAWTDGLDLTRKSDGGIKNSVLGGEGRVTEFRGEGRVWLQTRDPALFRGQSHGGNEDQAGADVGLPF